MPAPLDVLKMLIGRAKEAKIGAALQEAHRTPGATQLPRDLSELATRKSDPFTGKQVDGGSDFYRLGVKDPRTGGEAHGNVQHMTLDDVLDLYNSPAVLGGGVRNALLSRVQPLSLIDTVNMKSNGGGGVFYPVAYAQDLAAGRRNIATDLTPANRIRRTTNMLNSGLREGTLEHIMINPRQQGFEGAMDAGRFGKMVLPDQLGTLAARERLNVAQDLANYERATGEKLRVPAPQAGLEAYKQAADALRGTEGLHTTGESSLRRAALFDYISRGGSLDSLPPEFTNGMFKAHGGKV